MSIVDIVRDLERIKTNLPKYEKFPEITKNMIEKRETLEESFLDRLQTMRFKEGYCDLYALYTNWYKRYKGIDFL